MKIIISYYFCLATRLELVHIIPGGSERNTSPIIYHAGICEFLIKGRNITHTIYFRINTRHCSQLNDKVPFKPYKGGRNMSYCKQKGTGRRGGLSGTKNEISRIQITAYFKKVQTYVCDEWIFPLCKTSIGVVKESCVENYWK